MQVTTDRQPEAIDWVEPEIMATARIPVDDSDAVVTH